MSPLPDAAAGKLMPTLTYSYRWYNWVRCPDLQVGAVPVDGLLALRLKKFKGGEELDVYAVLYEGELPFEGHAFLLHNVFDRDQPEPYRVCVGPVVTCTCKSGKAARHRECKHVSSMVALIHRNHTEGGEMSNLKVMSEPQFRPALGDVVTLKCEAHQANDPSGDRQPRYTVTEIVTRTNLDGERERYVLRNTDRYGAVRENEFAAAEILGPG